MSLSPTRFPTVSLSSIIGRPPTSTLFPYTTLFRSMRHAATYALFTRRDVLIVASVSCIYGIGAAEAYLGMKLDRSEEHTSELQSRVDIVCRLLLEKKKTPRRTWMDGW